MSNPLYKNNEGYDSGCRITDEILRRSAEEIRAEVARLAPHWQRYSEDNAKKVKVTVTLKTTDYQDALAYAFDATQRFNRAYRPSLWQRFANHLRNLFGI